MGVKFNNDKYEGVDLSIFDADKENEVDLVITEDGVPHVYVFSNIRQIDDFIAMAQTIRDRFSCKIGGSVMYLYGNKG